MKEYLGDSVYVDFDGWYITLTTENGYGPSNTIHLEPEVMANLMDYRDRLVKKAQDANSATIHSQSVSKGT